MKVSDSRWGFFIILLATILINTLVQCDVGEDLSIIFQGPHTCNLFQNETFSWTTLGCVKCQWKHENKPDYCLCPPSYRLSQESSVTVEKCSKCPENTSVIDGNYCISCGDLNPFDSSIGKCQPCPSGFIEASYNDDGSPKEEIECIRCAEGYHPAPSGRSCVPCHSSFIPGINGTCRCPEVSHSLFGGICFLNSELSDPTFDRKSAYKMEYENSKIESPVLRDNLVAAFYLCKGKQNQTACQMLGNMCTLNLHSYGEEWTACRLYRTALPGPVTHPPNYIPKIYYSDVEAPSVLIRASTVPHIHNTDFSSTSSDVNITLARFSFDGKFLGLAELEDLLPCRESKLVLQAGRKFGTTFLSSCSVAIQDLWNTFQERMEFLDPYISYEDKGKGRQLYAIPVKIQNFKRNGIKVNTMDDKYQWQLVRRFFFVDTIGSVDFNTKKGEDQINGPKIVRYISNVHISVQLQNSKDAGKIYVPLLTLTFSEINQEEFIQNEVVKFEYSVAYYMDMSRSIEDVKISVGVLSALAVLWSAIQAWSWNRRSGQAEIDISTIINLLITSCGNLADGFFIVCFSTALFWFVFFKKQVAVHVFLPDVYQETLIRDLLISSFSLKIVEIIQLVMRQSNIDIFFVDWERPKVRSNIHPPSVQKQPDISKGDMSKVDKAGGEDSVSIWRTYFIANEWNEIQTTRKVHMATQIIASIFCLEVIGFKFWGLNWPNGDLQPEINVTEHIPYSTSARFVVASMVFGVIGIFQWIYRIGFYERYFENEIQDFVDLCTLGNISVFILSAKQHGYYIHGRSVHGFADTDMQTMIDQLHREEEDLCGRRGLLPQTDQQTFLISVPSTFRSVYNQVLQPLYASTISNTALLNKGRQLTGISKTTTGANKPTANMLNLSIHAYHSMNRFLTAFLEHALSDLDYDVTNKSFFEATFDMEFNEVAGDRAVFYNDDGHSFDSVLFYGHERTLFLFNLYTFIFVDILSHNYVLAGVVVFLTDLILKSIRNWLGKKNLARKTLIDSRFLI